MVRLALCLVLAAVVIQADATWNFNRPWDNVKVSDSDYKLGKCVWTWLQTLYRQGYSCDSYNNDYPRIRISTSYLANPSKDQTLSATLAQLKCTPYKAINPKNTVLCGNGWIRYNSFWCLCQGVLSCVNPTPAPATTTKKPTTRAPTTKTTKTTKTMKTTKTTKTTTPTTTTTTEATTPTPTPTPAPTTPTPTTPAPTTTAPETPAPTTPAATTTPAPTTTAPETPAPTTPAATTTVVNTTPQLSSPIITSSNVAAGSQVSFVGRQSYTYSFTITSNPAPSSVTISKGTFSAALSGFQLSSPADTYLYTYTFVVADKSYDGLWTVSADNNFGAPATYQFTVLVNWETIEITTWSEYTARPISSNNLIAFQLDQCANNMVTLAPQPGGPIFTFGDYQAGNYLFIMIENNFWFSNFALEGSGDFAGGDCTENPAPQPFWMMLQLTPLGSNAYSIALWTSPQHQYIPSTDPTVNTLTIPSLSYTIESVLFDQNVPDGRIPVYYYYPNAV